MAWEGRRQADRLEHGSSEVDTVGKFASKKTVDELMRFWLQRKEMLLENDIRSVPSRNGWLNKSCRAAFSSHSRQMPRHEVAPLWSTVGFSLNISASSAFCEVRMLVVHETYETLGSCCKLAGVFLLEAFSTGVEGVAWTRARYSFVWNQIRQTSA